MFASKSPTTTVFPLTAMEIPNQSFVARVDGVSSANCVSVTGGVAANSKDPGNKVANKTAHLSPILIRLPPDFRIHREAEGDYASKGAPVQGFPAMGRIYFRGTCCDGDGF